MKRFLTNIMILLTGLLFVINLLPYLAGLHFGFELFSHFRFQYLWLFALSSLFFIAVSNKKWLSIALVGLLLNAMPVLSFCCFPITSGTATAATTHKTSLLLSNLLSSNRHYQSLLDEVQSHRPDFIVLLEFSPAWQKALKPLDKHYPFQKRIPRNDNFGMALYSKFPLSNIEVNDFAQNGIPSISATAHLYHQSLQLIATHPLPPMNANMAQQQDIQLENLAHFIQQESKQATLLAGDFNSTPWSPRYQKLINASGLVNSRQGFGLIPSWPVALRFSAFQIPLDHVLVSKNIQTQAIKRLNTIGSDHYPVYVEFGLTPN